MSVLVPQSHPFIHPTALLDETVKLGKNVKIGPYCVITGHVELHDDVKLHSHVVIAGPTKTTIEEGCEIFPFASIGHICQDLKFKGEPTTLEIGKRTRIREYATIQPGTAGGISKTTVGDDCYLMVNTHVAHDCVVGNNVIMSNCSTLAGHVVVENGVIIGGLSAIHQFVRIGQGAMIGGMSGVERDVIPYGNVKGERAYLSGLNLIGMKRRGFSRDDMRTMKDIFEQLFFSEGSLSDRVKGLLLTHGDHPRGQEILNFVCSQSSRSFCLPLEKEGP